MTYPTVDELIIELCDDLGEDSADAEVYDRFERWIGDIFEDILSRQVDWKWARGIKELVLSPVYSTGTISISSGTTVTGADGASWDTGWKNRKLVVPTISADYRIASVGSTTSLTLESSYVDTALSGAAYYIVQDRYPLDNDAFEAGIKEIINPYTEDPLEEVDFTRLVRAYPRNRTFGDPTMYAFWGQELASATTNPNAPMVYFDQYPESSRLFYYLYHRNFGRLTSTDKIPIPYRHLRPMIFSGVKKNDKSFNEKDRSDFASEYEGHIGVLVKENTKLGKRLRVMRENDLPTRENSLRLPTYYPEVDF